MKSRKKRIIRGILAGVSVLLISVAIFVGAYARFPGKIKDGAF
jgi:phage shock protein PspC (stress-responsive transcriptional regulator)